MAGVHAAVAARSQWLSMRATIIGGVLTLLTLALSWKSHIDFMQNKENPN